MKVIDSFSVAGLKFQTGYLESQNRVQLWYRAQQGQPWEIGHGKEIPAGMAARDVAATMRRFIFGDINTTEYNELLPA